MRFRIILILADSLSKDIEIHYMNDNFNNQKEKLLSLSHEINLLRQQVNYLLRNGKALGLLDLDVLMNRTHAVYDLLCSFSVGENDADADLELDPEALAGLFGAMMPEVAQDGQESSEPDENVEQTAEEEAPAAEPVGDKEEILVQETEPAEVEEDATTETASIPDEAQQEEPLDETATEPMEETIGEQDVQDVESQPIDEAEIQGGAMPAGDDYGFFFRFEDTPPAEQEEKTEDEPVYVDDKLVHFMSEVPEEEIPERDRVDGEHLVQDNPFEMPEMEHGEAGFEMAAPETLGERMIQEDHSIAAKFQQNPVKDLKSVIGINDKFLFVNELFGGSMEKYNKSIENLNDLKTLNGAMIYLNELKIELQWNSSNEAYRKLSELVRRKFE